MREDEVISKLYDKEKEMLSAFYWHRLMDRETILEIFFHPKDMEPNERDCSRKINNMLQLGIIEQQSNFYLKEVYRLTQLGCKCVRVLEGFERNDYDPETKKCIKNYLTVSELRMNPKLVKHQLWLTKLLLEYKKYVRCECSVLDEKFIIRNATKDFKKLLMNATPDGLIETEGAYYFVEIDRGEESVQQLREKWDKYRKLVSSYALLTLEKPIIMVIVLCEVQKAELRRRRILKSMLQAFSMYLSENFSIAIEGYDEALEYMLRMGDINPLRAQRNAFLDILKQMELEPRGTCEAVTTSAYHSVYGGIFCNYKGRKFYLRDYDVFRDISSLSLVSSVYVLEHDLRMKYIVLVKNERELYNELKDLELLNRDEVWYTTLERLNQYKGPEAFFQFDYFGKLWRTRTYNMIEEVFEENYNKTRVSMNRMVPKN